jgi:hypothetical protein
VRGPPLNRWERMSGAIARFARGRLQDGPSSRAIRVMRCAMFCFFSGVISSAGAPVLRLSTLEWNFGEQDTGTIVSNRVELSNIGDEELLILALNASCGCTTTALSKRRLAPGERVDLDLFMNLQGRVGLQKKTVSIRSNDPQHPDTILTIRGEARTRVALMPKALSFGRIDPTKEPEVREVRLGGYMTNAVIVSVDPGGPFYQATIAPDRRSLFITPVVDATVRTRRQKMSVEISDPEVRQLSLFVFGLSSAP